MSTMDVLCCTEMIELLAPLDWVPVPVAGDDAFYVVARYDEDALHAVTDEQIADASAFWRWTPGLNIDVPYDESEIREWGLIRYIWHVVGVTSDRHVAGAIADLAHEAGMGQVEFVRWITTRVKAAAGQSDA